MAIEAFPPNTVHLGGPIEYLNDGVQDIAVEAITPGMLVERHVDGSNNLGWGVHDAADDPAPPFIALEQDELNLTVDDAYAAGDLMKVGALRTGSTFWGLLPSGQNITKGDVLQSNGDGRFKADAGGEGRYAALEDIGAITADTRCRIEVLW